MSKEIVKKENEIINKFVSIKNEFIQSASSQDEQETNQNVMKVDIEKYKKLLEKDTKQKEIQKKARVKALAKETPEQKEKRLTYLKEYARTHRDVDKEKEIYQKQKEHKRMVTARNMKKYLTFYKMYKDIHKDFEKEWDEKKESEKTLE